MLSSTFLHLKGIGAKKEAELWQSGISCWQEFEVGHKVVQLSLCLDGGDEFTASPLEPSWRALEAEDVDYFAARLPRREHYRIVCDFPKKTLFLDIETTGLSKYYDDVTVVGWSLDGQYDVYIQGGDIGPLEEALRRAKAIVTFNGSLFDLPFLKHHHAHLTLPTVHIDLRFFARRVGLSGGQKKLETSLGICRSEELIGMEGGTAPLLWHRYTRGDMSALQLLISYNRADVEGMRLLFDILLKRLINLNDIPSDCFNRSHIFSQEVANPASIVHLPKHVLAKLKPYIGRVGPVVTLNDLFTSSCIPTHRVVGIDLTGSEIRPSGWCFLDGRTVSTRRISTDKDLINATLDCHPDVVSIDSPLTLPSGRISVGEDDPGRKEFGIMRVCERTLKKRGINVYPCLLPSMQGLTARGIRLAEAFRARGIEVIESYPGAAQDIMGIPRKQEGTELLRNGLIEFGLQGIFADNEVSHDELDAITSAVVGLFYLCDQYEGLGSDDEGYLIVPKVNGDNKCENQT